MVLEINYRYIGLDYLVADKHGNLYLLPHFKHKRTVRFKKIKIFKNGRRYCIKYNGRNVSFIQLKQKALTCNDIININTTQ